MDKDTFDDRSSRLSDMLEEAVHLFQAPARAKNLDLRYWADPAIPPFLSGAAPCLQRVLVHLLNNALKFTRAGLIEVRIRLEYESVRDCLLLVSVRDTGPGIPEDMLRGIFDPAGAGSLALCRRMLDDFGGEIGAESRPGRGSIVWASMCLRKPSETPAPAPPLFRTLLASSIDHRGGFQTLEGAGRQVVYVSDDLDALLAHARAPFNLIVTNGPAEDAAWLAGHIRRREPSRLRVPIFLVATDPSAAAPEGITGLLPHPPTPEHLSALLERWDTPLDPAALRELAEIGGGESHSLVRKLIDIFLTDAPKLCESAMAACRAQDDRALQKAAHAIKSVGGTVGARRLWSLCWRMERLARLRAGPLAASLGGSVEEELIRVRRSLENERARLPDAPPEAEKPDGAGPAAAPATQAEPSSSRGTKTVVVCDDDRTLLHIVRHILQKQGFSVFIADDGEEGLSLVRSHDPSLLILDLELPLKSGLDILQEMKGQRAPYVMILSNCEDAEQHEKAKSLGAREILVKPFLPGALSDKIRSLISGGRI